MIESWAEKYRPAKLDEVEGNPKALADLRAWAQGWESRSFRKGFKKAAILVGEPGTGKTSSALAVAAEFKWGVVELNASDSRNAAAIRKFATIGAISDTFTSSGDFLRSAEGGEKLIILDEVDNVFGREDQGGLQAIVDTIERTAQPIILTANDYYELSRRSAKIKDLCLVIKFQSIRSETIRNVLRRIAAKEQIEVEPGVLDFIAGHSEGDMRSAVNDFQSVAYGHASVTLNDLKSIGDRDLKKSIFDAMSQIFRTCNAKEAKQALWNLDEQPDFIILWLDENIPIAYRDPGDIKRAFDALSMADVFLGRVNRKKQFAMWRYANDFMTAGVALAKKKGSGAGGGYQFPSYLRKMSQYRGVRGTRESLLGKIAGHCHTSRAVARRDILPFFKVMFLRSREFQAEMILNICGGEGLEDLEVAMLLGEPVSSHAVRHAMEDAQKAGAMRAQMKPDDGASSAPADGGAPEPAADDAASEVPGFQTRLM